MAAEERSEAGKNELDLLEFLVVLLKHKRMILGVTAAFGLVAMMISLVIPKTYEASSRILPPQQGGSSALVAQLVGQFSGIISGGAGGALGGLDQSQLYVDLLRSRTIADRIVERFSLVKLYDEPTMVETRKELAKNRDVEADPKSGLVTISVRDEDPKRAADMANAFVEELKRLTQGLAISEASQRRLFFEEQLSAAKAALTTAEEELKAFQEQTGALKVEDQAKAVIEGIATLMAQIAAKEVELKVMRTYSTPNNPDLQRMEESLKGLKAELKRMEAKEGSVGHDPLMPTGRMPAVGTEYVRKMRNAKFNESLYELLMKQYEVARMDEAKDAAVIQVVDQATPPDKKSRPKRAIITIIGTVLGLFLSSFAAFVLEWKKRASSREMLDTLREHLRF